FASHARISSIFDSTIKARRRLSFGATKGLPLVVKMFKPIKVARSRTADEFGVDERLVAEAQPQLGATQTSVLREANAAVRSKLACFDLADRGSDQLAELTPLLVADRGLEILDLGNTLADKGHNRHIGNPADPGVADQLRIKSQQTLGLLRVACRGRLPFKERRLAVQG